VIAAGLSTGELPSQFYSKTPDFDAKVRRL